MKREQSLSLEQFRSLLKMELFMWAHYVAKLSKQDSSKVLAWQFPTISLALYKCRDLLTYLFNSKLFVFKDNIIALITKNYKTNAKTYLYKDQLINLDTLTSEVQSYGSVVARSYNENDIA